MKRIGTIMALVLASLITQMSYMYYNSIGLWPLILSLGATLAIMFIGLVYKNSHCYDKFVCAIAAFSYEAYLSISVIIAIAFKSTMTAFILYALAVASICSSAIIIFRTAWWWKSKKSVGEQPHGSIRAMQQSTEILTAATKDSKTSQATDC